VPGHRIGEALAEIDTHCADSGQSLDEAFGDPVDYARALARDAPPTGSARTPGRPWTSALMALGTLGGILCLLDGVDAVTHGLRAALTVGQLVTVVAGTAGIAVIAGVVLRPGRRTTAWRVGLAAAAGVGLTMVPQLVWTHPVVHVRGWAALTTGLLLLAVAWWPRASTRIVADRIIDPRTATEPFRVPRLALTAIRWSLPVTLLCAVVLTMLLPDTPR
jgi:hypothetical protein